MYTPGSLATSSLRSEAELATDRRRLDEAYDTLLDPLRRRAYDLSTFSEAEAAATPEISPKPAMLAEQIAGTLFGREGPGKMLQAGEVVDADLVRKRSVALAVGGGADEGRGASPVLVGGV